MKRIIQGLAWLAGTFGALGQGTIVVPNHLANAEGNSSVSDFLNERSFRMQLVIDASQFAQLSDAPNVTNYLMNLSLRPDGALPVASAVGYFFGGSSVTLSATTRSPDSLSPVFAENVTGAPVTVWSGAAAFGGSYQAGQSPQPFTENIAFTTPFRYSPSMGNLLVDIRGVQGQVLFPGALDAENTLGDSVSRVFGTDSFGLSGTADSLGLVTRFNFIAVPEPSTWAFLVLGSLVGLSLLRRR